MIGDSFLVGEEYYFCQEIEYYAELWNVWRYGPAIFV